MRRRWREWATSVAVAVGTVGAVVVPAEAAPGMPPRQAGDVAQRGQLEDRISELQSQLRHLDAELPGKEAAVEGAAARVGELVAELTENQNEQERVAQARELPARARQELVLALYTGGDPQERTALEFIRDGELRTASLRRDVLFHAAEEDTLRKLRELDARAAELTAARAETEVLWAQATLAEAAAREELTVVRAARDGTFAELEVTREQLRVLVAASRRGPLNGALDYPIRPAVGVKIDNSPSARPQSGLLEADVVYEQIVEGGVTRFLAFYQSRDAERIGPVRSARTSDVGLVSGYNWPIIAYSGGNDGVLAAMGAAAAVSLTESNAPRAYLRDDGRWAPYNLFTSTAALYASGSSRAGMPPEQFAFRADGAGLPAGARPVNGVVVRVGDDDVGYSWTGAGWARTTNGRPHVDTNGAQVAPENVIVQFTNYAVSVADAASPDAITVGSGTAWILTAGHLIEGRWARATAAAPIQYVDASGAQIPLTPGRTWIALPRPGTGAAF